MTPPGFVHCGCPDCNGRLAPIAAVEPAWRRAFDAQALAKAKAKYVRLKYERLYGPRPWWWWLAVGIVAALFGVEAWLVYRVVAGWPVADLFLLQRLAG